MTYIPAMLRHFLLSSLCVGRQKHKTPLQIKHASDSKSHTGKYARNKKVNPFSTWRLHVALIYISYGECAHGQHVRRTLNLTLTLTLTHTITAVLS